MLSGDEPLQATARKMDSRNRNRQIHYEGDVHMWQGANRIQADVVDVDRNLDPQKRTLVADGHVVTNLWEEPKDEKKKKSRHPRAHRGARRAHGLYRGQPPDPLHRRRPAEPAGPAGEGRRNCAPSSPRAAPIRAWKRPSPMAPSRSSPPARTARRNGTGEHAEYYTDDQKVILTRSAGAHGGKGVRQAAAQHHRRHGSRPTLPTMIGW